MAVKKKQASSAAPSEKTRALAAQVHERLTRAIPEPHIELRFETPWQLLVAVILSAQTTDKVVNKVMSELLARWSTPQALAAASQEEVEAVVKPTSFFRTKAKAVREASRLLVERHGGQVPRTLEELQELPGVARKTACMVLGAAYGVVGGVIVDTHTARVAQRLGLTEQEKAEKIEAELCALFDCAEWLRLGHRFILHGRYLCTAKAPRCAECTLNELCPSRAAPAEGSWQERAQAEQRELAERGEGFSPAQARG
jgi:endonuclease-3